MKIHANTWTGKWLTRLAADRCGGVSPLACQIRARRPDNGLERDAPAMLPPIMTRDSTARQFPAPFHRRWTGAWIFVLALVLSVGARAEFSEKVVESAKEATVRVVSIKGEGASTGTGIIISTKGYVVTNYHVVKDGEKVAVIYGRGRTAFIKEASIVVSDPGKDLVILKCGSLPQTQDFIVADHETSGGQEVMAIGFPGILDDLNTSHGTSDLKPNGRPDEFMIDPSDVAGHVPVSFPGNVGKEMRIESGFGGDFRAIAHSAKISEGNSGGPLIDKEGRMVGINVQIASNKLGADYAFAIHASELVTLARANSIPIDVTTSKVSIGAIGGSSGMQMLLLVVLAAFAIVMFLMVLRKPRMVMVDAVSKLVHSRHQPAGHGASRVNIPASPRPRGSMNTPGMRLRGRDLQGCSYDISFSDSDFQLSGGKLVIGRNNDLSQLHLSHDSVSRQHATLSSRGGTIHVEDRNSGNGTKVNGREIAIGSPPVALQPGDKLTLGEVDLIFEVTR